MRCRIWEWIAVNLHLKLVLPTYRICVIENQLSRSAGKKYTPIKIMKLSLFTPDGYLLHLIKKFIIYVILQMFDQ